MKIIKMKDIGNQIKKNLKKRKGKKEIKWNKKLNYFMELRTDAH